MREATWGFHRDRNMTPCWGEFMPFPDMALSVRRITCHVSVRIARRAFELSMKSSRNVTAIHGANGLQMTDGWFLECARAVATGFSQVQLGDLPTDASTGHLVRNPERFDMRVAENFYVDILSDPASE